VLCAVAVALVHLTVLKCVQAHHHFVFVAHGIYRMRRKIKCPNAKIVVSV